MRPVRAGLILVTGEHKLERGEGMRHDNIGSGAEHSRQVGQLCKCPETAAACRGGRALKFSKEPGG
jgi:hypothetical protein